MRILLKFITVISIFISFLNAADVNTTIINIANIEYSIDGIDKNQTTNEVKNIIEQTDAIIEFLKYDENGESNTLRPTKYKNSSGSYSDMPDAKLKDGTTINPPANIQLSNTSTYSNEDLVVVRVTDLDQNKDSTKIDTVTITITDPNTGDSEELILQESGVNTGVFIGYTQTVSSSTQSGDGYISVLPDDKISATYNDNGINKTVVTNANIIVDKTKATIEFLTYTSDDASKEILKPVKCKGSDGKWHTISEAYLNSEDSITTPSSLNLVSTTSYLNRDLVVIKVTDLDQNIHSDKLDYVEITVKDPTTNDIVTLQLEESGINTGVFIGFTQSVAKSYTKVDCELNVNPNDKIYTYYNDKSEDKIIFDVAIIKTEKTEATIEFLKYTENNTTQDSNGTVNLKPTMCYSNGKWQEITEAELPTGEAITPPKNISILDATEYYTQDFVVIRVIDLDQNIYDDKIDSIKIDVTNPSTGDKITLKLFETEIDSGIFVGYTHTTPNKTDINDCRISVNAGDIIYTSYFDESHNKKRVDSAKIKALPYSIMVTKQSSKDEVSIGEFVKYTISIKNLRKISLRNIDVIDKLPDGLKYIENSFKDNNKKKEINLSDDGKTLSYKVDKLSIGETKEFSYIATVTSNAKDEEINQAWAKGNFGITSNLAKHLIKITEELYRTKGYIIGKVYNSECNNSNKKLCGIEGVKLYMEDGRYTVTDNDGRYHFLDVNQGSHIVQIDELSIKDRYKIELCNNNTNFANRGNSQFVEILHSELRRVDFCLKPLPNSKFKSLLSMKIKKLDKSHLELIVKIDSTKKLLEPEVYIALPDGISFVKNSTTGGKEADVEKNILIIPMDNSTKSVKLEVNLKYPIDDAIEAMLYYDTKIAQDQHTNKIILPIKNETNNIKLAKIEATTIITKHEKKDAKGDFGWSKPTKEQTMPNFTPEKLDEYGNDAKIIWPPKGWVPSIPSAKIVVLYGKDEHIELSLNGKKVSGLNYEKLFKNSNRSMRAIYYKGVDLAEGQNIITATVKDRANKVVKTLTREVWVESHLPAKIEYLKEFSYLRADGKHTPIIAVKFLAKSGHPLRGGLVGSFEVDGDYEPYIKQNGKGSFKIDSDGIAYIRLKPTTKAGIVKLKFKLIDDNEQIIETKLTPHFRDWIVVGFAEGSIGYEILSKNSEPLNSKVSTDSKVAFFAKGKIKGKYLLTIAYDSSKKDKELFDEIDPEKYYLIYGDNSKQMSEAPSTNKLFIKLESQSFYAMFGDIKSAFSDTKFMNYDRSFTGLKSVYDKDNLRVNSFIAKTRDVHLKEEFRGDGTNGYYYLKSKDIVKNSEKVTIEIRDRLHPSIILEKKSLSRYSDYDIDYTQSRIFFKEPIYSVDKKLNPIYIVVEYDIENDSSEFYTWGVDAEYKIDNLTFNTRIISEDSAIKKSLLYGISTHYEFNKNSSIYAEVAQSKTTLESQIFKGNAHYVELKYSDDNLTIKSWYRYEDENFGFDSLEDSNKANQEIAISATKKLNKNFEASVELSNQKEYNSTKSDTTTATAKLEYKDKNNTASIGFRHIKSNTSSNQILASYERKMLDNNLTLGISHEQNLNNTKDSSYPTLTTLEANYKVDKNTTIFMVASREQSDSDTSYKTQVGLSYKPWKDAQINLSRTMQDGGDIDSIYNLLSFRQNFKLNNHYTLKVGYEKGFYENDNNSNFDALNGAIEYTDKNTSAYIAIGGRISEDDKKLNVDIRYSRKNSKESALAFGAKSSSTWSKESETRSSEAQLSYVYRPLNSKVTILDKLEFNEEYNKENNSTEQTLKFINNMHINYQLNDKWEFGLQYGLKYIIDTIDDEEYDSWVDLLALFAEYHYSEDLSFGTQASILHTYSSNNFSYGFGVYATKTLWDNANITFGYNIKGFEDSDFNLQNNYSSKIYMRVRIKFDQNDLKNILKEVE